MSNKSNIFPEQLLVPAQLFVGERTNILHEVYSFLQRVLCQHGGCGVCQTCKNIVARRHRSVCWFAPEKNQYTRIELETIGQRISFMLDEHEDFFFVLESVELLSASCANMLLKSIEEPPRGYHFILLAQRRDLVLPTILSRCTEFRYAQGAAPEVDNEFLEMLKKPVLSGMTVFTETFDRYMPAERETLALLDQLQAYWRQQLHEGISKSNQGYDSQDCMRQAQAMIRYLDLMSQCLPAQGSAKLFWRTVYVQSACIFEEAHRQ